MTKPIGVRNIFRCFEGQANGFASPSPSELSCARLAQIQMAPEHIYSSHLSEYEIVGLCRKGSEAISVSE